MGGVSGGMETLATPAIEIDGLTVRFGDVVAVDSVSFSVARCEMVAVIGPSGAGKSTLLRAINRLVPISEGRLVADGVDVTRLRGRALHRWRARGDDLPAVQPLAAARCVDQRAYRAADRPSLLALLDRIVPLA